MFEVVAGGFLLKVYSRNSTAQVCYFLLSKQRSILNAQSANLNGALMFFPPEGIKDIPPSGVTRPICGIMGTIRLVAGRFCVITMFRFFRRIRNVVCITYTFDYRDAWFFSFLVLQGCTS